MIMIMQCNTLLISREFFFYHLLDYKPQKVTESLRDLLANNIDCYLPGSSIPANENQVINYFLQQAVAKDILPQDIIEHSVSPNCRNVDVQAGSSIPANEN